MRILFLTDNFPPEVNAPATRTYEHCSEWTKLGAEVTVVTCVPNFPHGNVYEGYKNRLYQVEYMNGIRVIRIWSYITANNGFVKRTIDYMSFAVSAFFSTLTEKADIIIATSPQFFTTLAAFGLSKIKGKPWVFEVRDLWPESIKVVGAIESKTLIWTLEKIELFLYKKASLIVAVTDAFKKNLIRRGIDENKIKVVTNGANMELFKPREKNERLLEDLGLKGKFVVSYIGTHGLAHSLEFIVAALEKVKDEDIHFLFIGDGARKMEVIRLAREKGLKNVTFLDAVPKEKIPDYLSITDVSLIPLLKSETFKTVIPSKIFEAAAMKKPILLGVEGQAQEIVEKYGAGVCFEPENEGDFIEKLHLLKNNHVIYGQCQEGCAQLAKDYDRKRLAQLMYQYLSTSISTS
jgi:glycosyltransferase involved in cell wall biosynthesis